MIAVTFHAIGDAPQHAEFPTLAECSAWHTAQCDEAAYGASEINEGVCTMPDGRRLRVSYNGRVWDGTTCVFNPYEVE